MKAVALISGGLDSILAVKLIESLGIKVYPINYSTPFWSDKVPKQYKKYYKNLKIIDISKEFLKVIKKPKHGYGKNINPCIDCKIFMLKQAKKYAKKIKADFIFTGEVLGQRPMSQKENTLQLIAKQAGLKGKLLRPLSAKILPGTEIEKKGLVDRNKLLSLQGRQRKEQYKLAKKFKIKIFSTPAGGCLLTEPVFANKVRDLLKYQKTIKKQDLGLLKIGRHFRINKDTKIIVGRNHEENQIIEKTKSFFVVEKDIPSPSTIIIGKEDKKIIQLAAELTAAYAKTEKEPIEVNYKNKTFIVNKILKQNFQKYLI